MQRWWGREGGRGGRACATLHAQRQRRVWGGYDYHRTDAGVAHAYAPNQPARAREEIARATVLSVRPPGLSTVSFVSMRFARRTSAPGGGRRAGMEVRVPGAGGVVVSVRSCTPSVRQVSGAAHLRCPGDAALPCAERTWWIACRLIGRAQRRVLWCPSGICRVHGHQFTPSGEEGRWSRPMIPRTYRMGTMPRGGGVAKGRAVD